MSYHARIVWLGNQCDIGMVDSFQNQTRDEEGPYWINEFRADNLPIVFKEESCYPIGPRGFFLSYSFESFPYLLLIWDST